LEGALLYSVKEFQFLKHMLSLFSSDTKWLVTKSHGILKNTKSTNALCLVKPVAMGFTGIGLTLALPQSGPYSCNACN
jgi:hypothetical protein